MIASDVNVALLGALVCSIVSVSAVLGLRLAHGWPPARLTPIMSWTAWTFTAGLVALWVAEELFEAEARHGARLDFTPAFAIAAGTLLLPLVACSIAAGPVNTRSRPPGRPLLRHLALAVVAIILAALLATWFSNIDAPALFDAFADNIPT